MVEAKRAEVKAARAAEAAKIPASALEFKPADVPDEDILSGEYVDESRKMLRSFYSAQAGIIADNRRRGITMPDEEVRRLAATKVAFTPKKVAGITVPSSRALSALGTLASDLTTIRMGEDANARATRAAARAASVAATDPLAEIDKREKFVRALETRLGGDELTASLVKRMDADAKKFDAATRANNYPKLIRDFKSRYVAGRMQQTGNDKKLNSTNPQEIAEARAAEESFNLEADKTLDSLRVAGNPVIRGGMNVVTVDTVNDAFGRGPVEGLREVANIFLPQVAPTATGKAVRVESIPSAVLRGVSAPVAALASAIPMPGERGGINLGAAPGESRGLRGDPLARIQAGRTPLVDAMENDWVRNALERGDAADKALAIGVLTAAGAAEVSVPGLEVVAAPAAGLALGKTVDAGRFIINASDALAVARAGKAGGLPPVGIPGAIRDMVDTVKRAKSIYSSTRDEGKLFDAVIAARGNHPTNINVTLDEVNPALARVYRDEFLKAVDKDADLKKVLDALVEDAPPAERSNEFRVLVNKDQNDIVTLLDDAATRAADDVARAEKRVAAADDALKQSRLKPTTEEIERTIKAQAKTLSVEREALTKAKAKSASLEALRGIDPQDIRTRISDASDEAVRTMLGEKRAAPEPPTVPSAAAIDVQDVQRVFGTLVTPTEAQSTTKAKSLHEWLRGKGDKSLTVAESAVVKDLISTLRSGPAGELISIIENEGQRLVTSGQRTAPYSELELLRRLDSADAARAFQKLQEFEAREAKVLNQLAEDAIEMNDIQERFISSAEAKLRLKAATDAVNDALKNAKMASQDLQRARSMKVPKAQVKAAAEATKARKTATVPPVSEVTVENAVDIASDPSAAGVDSAAVAQQLDAVNGALRTVVPDNAAARLQVEMRYGLDRNRIYGVTNEPWERPDLILTDRPPITAESVRDPKHLYKLARNRGIDNVERYLMADGPAIKATIEKNFNEALNAQTVTKDNADKIRKYLDAGMAEHDTAKREFAARVGLPHFEEYITGSEFWGRGPKFDGAKAKKFYDDLDKIAASMPDGTRRARGENVYFRWLGYRSAPEGFDPLVARLDDFVEVRNPNLAEQAGPLRQTVVLPDGTTRFADEGAVSDRFTGYIVGAEVRDGKQYLVVQPTEYVTSKGPQRVRVQGRSVLVPAEEAILSERGRVPSYTVGTGRSTKEGVRMAVYDIARPMTNAEWAALAEREKVAFKGSAGKIRYDGAYNRHVTEPIAPPKRPTATDFDISPDDAMDANGYKDLLKRAVPKPQVVKETAPAAAARVAPEEAPTVAGRAAPEEGPLYTGEDRPTEVKRRVVNAAMNNRDNAVERLDQVRREAGAVVAESRIPDATLDKRFKELIARQAKLEQERQRLREAINLQSKVVKGLDEYGDLADSAYDAVSAPRRAMADQLERAQRNVAASLAAETGRARDLIAETRAASFPEREINLQRQVQEEVRRVAASTPGMQKVAELGRGVGALFSSAREVVEGTVPKALRDLNREIERMGDAAARDLQAAVDAVNVTDPNQRLTTVMQMLDDTNYGSTWKTTQELGNLDPRAVDSMAFAYVEDVPKFLREDPALADELRKTVRTMTFDEKDIGSMNDLSYIISGMTPERVMGERAIATGDIQFAQAVMSQGIINHATTQMLSLGALYTKEEMLAIYAWMRGGDVSTREAARGRDLALAIYGSAVDTRKPINGIADFFNAPENNSLVSAIRLTGATIEEGMTEGTAAAEVLKAYEKVLGQRLYLPETVARQLDKTVNDMLIATRGGVDGSTGWFTNPGWMFGQAYKKSSVYGLFSPRTEFYLNNLVQDADQLAVSANAGMRQGLRSMAGSVLANLFATKPLGVPVSVAYGLADLMGGYRAGTYAEKSVEIATRINNWLGLAAYGTETSKLLNASEDVSRLYGLSYKELRDIFLRAGGGNTIMADEVVRDLNKAFNDNRAYAAFRKVFTDQTDAIGAMLTDRKRAGAFLSLLERNIKEAGGAASLGEEGVRQIARESADDMVAALMDYSANLHPIEKNLVFQVFQPFWAFDKSNMIRVARLLTQDGNRVRGAVEAARSGYRFGRWTRGKVALAQTASFLLENHDQNGFDVDAMKADDAARAEQMRKEGKSQAEIDAEMLYPRYEQQIRLLKQSGISSRDLRLNALAFDDDYSPAIAPFLDYYVPKLPRYFEPDEFSANRTPFSVVVADSRLRGLQLANDAANPKNDFGSDSISYFMGPEDSNLSAFNRVFAISEAITAGAKEVVNEESDPELSFKLSEAFVKTIGNPDGYNPVFQSIFEIMRSSYAEPDSPTLRPVTLGAYVGGPIANFFGIAEKTNTPIGIETIDSDMGQMRTNLVPGYQIPAQTAVYLRAVVPQLISALGEPKDAEDLVQVMSALTEDPTNKRLKLELDRVFLKAQAGIKNRRVFIQSRDRSAEGIVTGRIARTGGMPATRTPEERPPESIKAELLARGQQYTAALSNRGYEADRSLFYTKLAAGESVDASIAAAFAVEEGLLTPEQFNSQDIQVTLDMLSANPRIRQTAREAGQNRLDRLAPNARLGAIEMAKRSAKANTINPDFFAILRADLADRGLDPDKMSNQDIITYYKGNP